MKWTFIIRQKFRAAIALGIVFISVLATQLMDKNYYSKLQKAFSSVYEDRLVAEVYIYEISGQLLKKKKLIERHDEISAAEMHSTNQTYSDSIKSLLSKYEETKLTIDELLLFNKLKKNLTDLFMLEEKQKGRVGGALYRTIEKQHDRLAANLDGLSKIQLSEGKSLINNSKHIIDASNLMSKLEICILIVIGTLVQALIFTSNSLMPRFIQNKSMN